MYCTSATPNGSYQPNESVYVTAYASSGVTGVSGWLNGQLQANEGGNKFQSIYGQSTASNQLQTFTVTAYNGSTAVATVSNQYKLYYGCLGFNASCNAPYIKIQAPANYADATSPFTVQAGAVGNTAPITTTKLYLDNTLVATSTGATIVATVTGSAGTHLLTVQSWDTTGTLYKTQHTVNIN